MSPGGGALSAVTLAAETLQEPLSSQSPNALYDRKEMRELRGRLLDGEGAYWHFYARKSVERLIEEAG